MDSVPGRDFPYLHHEANFCPSPDMEERPTSITYPYLTNQFSNSQPAPGFPYQRYDASQNLDSLRSATNHPHPLLFSGSHTPEASKEEQAVSQLGNLASSKLVPNSAGGIDLSSTSLQSAHLKHGALGAVGGVPHSSVTDNHTKVSSCYSPYFGSYNNHQEIQQATLNQLAEGLSYLQHSRHFSEEVFPPQQGGENLSYVMGRTIQGHSKDGGGLGVCQETVDSMASKEKILSPSFYRSHDENFTKQSATKGLIDERKSVAAKLSHLRGHNTQTSQQNKSMQNTLNLSQGRSRNCKVKFILKGNLARPYPLLINNPKPFVDYSFDPVYQCDATLYGDDVCLMDSGVQHFWPYHDSRRKLSRPTNHQGEFPHASYSEGEEDLSSNPLDFLRDFVLNEKGQLNNSDLKKLKQKLHQPFAITSPSFNKATAPAVMTTTVTDNATMVTISIANKKQGVPARTTTVDSGIQSGVQTSNQNKNSTDKSKVLLKGRKEGKENHNESIEQRSKSDKEENKDRLEINIRIDDSQLVQCGDQKRWQCHLCEKSYTTKHNLVTHILDHNGIKPHLCMVCGKYFKQLSHLNTHMLTHDNIKPHVCCICSKSFTQVSHLKRHQAVHLSEQHPHRCDTCGMGFAFPGELQIHKEKHEKGEENRCSECGEEFDSQRALKLHVGYHRNFPNLVCKYCNKYFRYPSQLKDHLLSHEGARPYICSECGMDFYKEHHLKVHEYTHSGKKPWECPHCGRCFNQKANMQRHLLIHNAERKYKCETCGKTFTQPQTLKAHMVVHAEKKPFECQFCGKQFGRLHNLQGHLHMHNNTKPYICFCGSSFTLRGNLNRHKKVKHGLNESTENLEEEAVSFLNELSDRTRPESEAKVRGQEENLSETINSETDDEKDSDQSNSRTPRKARKSIPRKYTYKRRTHQDVSEDNYSEEEKDTEIHEDEEKSSEERKNLRMRKRKKFEPERVYASENEGEEEEYNPGHSSVSKVVKKRKS